MQKEDLLTRLFKYVVVEDRGYKTPCWVWHGGLSDRGYGKCWTGEKRERFHIVMFTFFKGPVPEGLELDHLCRVRPCGNPDHVEPVTHQENIRRGETGIVNRSKTHCHKGHEFTPENTRKIKGGRSCRQCSRDWYNANLKSTNPDLKYWGRKLTKEQVAQIPELRKRGLSLKQIGDGFGVSKSTIHNVEKGKNYQEVLNEA